MVLNIIQCFHSRCGRKLIIVLNFHVSHMSINLLEPENLSLSFLITRVLGIQINTHFFKRISPLELSLGETNNDKKEVQSS